MATTTNTEQDSKIMAMFQSFRTEMDEQQERRERIVKASRDITSNSKKMIFSLQRAQGILHHKGADTANDSDLAPDIQKDISTRTETIHKALTSILPDVSGPRFWRFERSISGGIQEFVEAISFKHYLRTGELISLQGAQRELDGASVGAGHGGNETVRVTESDYALGLLDLTGELMRFAITSLSLPSSTTTTTISSSSLSNEKHAASSATAISQSDSTSTLILRDLQRLFLLFSSSLSSSASSSSIGASGNDNVFGNGRDFSRKMKTFAESVEKVENTVCSVIIRGSERPPGWMPDTTDLGDRMDES